MDEMTRLKKKRLQPRRPDIDIVIVELDADLADAPESDDMALLMFEEMDVRPAPMFSQMFTDARLRYFGICRASRGLSRDCALIAREGRPTIVFHGVSCNMTKAIDRDMKSGVELPFEYCTRRTQGTFRLIEDKAVR
jgi:hypothetical protein